MEKQTGLRFDDRRPLSWSAISCFEWDRDEWFSKYVLGRREVPSREMKFGSAFGKSIEEGRCEVEMDRYDTFEQKLQVRFGDIPLIGFIDNWDSVGQRGFRETKTGKKEWTQKRANDHGQLRMYALMIYITYGINPESLEIYLDWFPTVENNDFTISLKNPPEIHTFRVKVTMRDILDFGAKINRIYAEMREYAEERIKDIEKDNEEIQIQ